MVIHTTCVIFHEDGNLIELAAANEQSSFSDKMSHYLQIFGSDYYFMSLQFVPFILQLHDFIL